VSDREWRDLLFPRVHVIKERFWVAQRFGAAIRIPSNREGHDFSRAEKANPKKHGFSRWDVRIISSKKRITYSYYFIDGAGQSS
jgi:hypothetical protein